MTIDWQPLWKIIQDHQSFVLSCHVRPDADALGSELALAEFLEGLGKRVSIANPSAAPSTLDFLDPEQRAKKLGDGISAQQVLEHDVHIVLDTSAWVQLAEVGRVMRRSNAVKCVIDHHVSSDNLGAIEFKDTTSEATGALVFQLAQACGLQISPTAATNLFCAIATDTGWFRFPSTTSGTMRTIAQLIDFGAKPALLYSELYERRTLARMKLTGRVLGRTLVECDGRLAYTFVSQNDFAETGATPVDTEDLVNECLRIDRTLGAFIAVEQESRRIKFSFRGREPLNVAAVAEPFGGGGHKLAAGAVLPGPLDQALQKVRGAMTQAVNAVNDIKPHPLS